MTMYEAVLLGCRQAADLSVMKLMIDDEIIFCFASKPFFFVLTH